LKENHECKGINTQGKIIKEVQSIEGTNDVLTHIEMDDVQEGLVGRPKGIQHILWE